MINQTTKNILDRRPNINFVAPRSGVTIPEPQLDTTPVTPKDQRVGQLITKLNNVANLAEQVEKLVADRVKDEVLRLNLSNPEDALVAQAAARCFPEHAVDTNGFVHVPEITFEMYNKALQNMKAAGRAAGNKQMTAQREPIRANKSNFGGSGQDRRPDVNQSTIPFAPINLPAFIAAGIPVLFGMLFPLINAAIKKDIVGHTHMVVTGPPSPIPVPSLPGIPVLP